MIMKNSAMVMFSFLTAVSVVTAQEPSDTIKVINNAHSVLVTRGAGSQTITVIGSSDNKNYYFTHTTETETPADSTALGNEDWGLSLPFLKGNKTRKKSEFIYFGQTYIGIVNPLSAPDGLDRSIECGIGQIVGLSYSPWIKGPSFAIGMGIHYQQYTLHRNQIFGCENKRLTIESLGEGLTDPSSRLRNFGVTVPFTVTQKIAGDFAVTVGATLKLNTFTKATSTFHKGDVTYKRDFKGLQQRMLSYDIYGAIGLCDEIGLYVRYTPLSLFKTADGPRFETISFGITLGL